MIASGPNPGSVVYTIEARTTLPRITAIRLEALPDPSLPKGGPGRDIYGNFQVNGVEIEAEPIGPQAFGSCPGRVQGHQVRRWRSEPRHVLPEDSVARCLRAARMADRRQPGRHAAAAPDRLHPRASAQQPRRNAPARQAQASTGRWSASRSAASGCRSRPAPRRSASSRFRRSCGRSWRAAADRTEQQRKDLNTLYRTVATSLKPARDRLAALQKELKALGIPTALVMRERIVHERPSAYVRRRGSFLDKGSRSTPACPPSCTRSATTRCRTASGWRAGSSTNGTR